MPIQVDPKERVPTLARARGRCSGRRSRELAGSTGASYDAKGTYPEASVMTPDPQGSPADHGATPGEDDRVSGALPSRFAEIYDDLHAIARGHMRRDPTSTLQPTALIHEAYIKMAGSGRAPADRGHFFAAAAQALRHALIEHHRRKTSEKRGGHLLKHTLATVAAGLEEQGIDWVGVHDLLENLEGVDAQMVQLIDMKLFGGASMDEIAEFLAIPKRTVERRWATARALLKTQLEEQA